MNTVEELLHYCKEPEPVGAVLLTGEWGCGKTYLIDNELTEELGDQAHVIRISLFGITTIEGIHVAVKQAWISECNKDKKWKNLFEKAQQGKEAVEKLDFLPEWLRGIATTDWQSFIEIKNTIEETPVILVFDDLERCCLDSIDVLGVINDYCENRKFHTIIVANQDKINVQSKKAEDELSYTEIKEKIIHRTVQYIPDYANIVYEVIEKMKYHDDEYKNFVEECREGILELFAPDRNVYNESQNSKRPHNIRSLKCAIRDFYRIFGLLKYNEFEDIDKWFYSFIVYVIAHKANIAKDGYYGTSFSDDDVRKLYPAFQPQYMLITVKKWILHGVWDKNAFTYELETVKSRDRAETPADIVRTHQIMDIDEDVILEGFPKVVEMAYAGDLSLDEYVYFIQNNCWGREYHFKFSVIVEWSEVQNGLNNSIKKLLDSRQEGQQLHSFIGEDNKKFFSEDEWKTYQIIEDFRKGDLLMFSNNKNLYIEGMSTDAFTAFSMCQNKRFDMFDEKMAVVTAEAYAKGNNSEKHQFVGYFKDMWEKNIISQDIKVEKSLDGFHKLYELLSEQKEDLKNNGKTFAVQHTKNFIECVDAMIKKLEENI